MATAIIGYETTNELAARVGLTSGTVLRHLKRHGLMDKCKRVSAGPRTAVLVPTATADKLARLLAERAAG